MKLVRRRIYNRSKKEVLVQQPTGKHIRGISKVIVAIVAHYPSFHICIPLLAPLLVDSCDILLSPLRGRALLIVALVSPGVDFARAAIGFGGVVTSGLIIIVIGLCL